MRGGAAIACALALACTHEDYDAGPPHLSAFRVELATNTPAGSVDEPLLFPSAIPAEVTLSAIAVDQHGDPFPYNGRAGVSVVPGELSSDRRVLFIDGVAWTPSGTSCAAGCPDTERCDEVTARCLRRGVDVRWRFSYGATHIWIEDIGELGDDECHNERDDDGDGLVDAFDVDCAAGATGAVSKATLATGISPTLTFARPRIRDMQFSPRCNTDTPLGGQNLNIATGTLVVTGTTQSGLYVTDLTGPEGGYNSVYLFTFSNPQGVRRGDRLCEITGNVAEFIGNTQLNFPSFVNADTDLSGVISEKERARCDLPSPELVGDAAAPEPKVLTGADIGNLPSRDRCDRPRGTQLAPTEDFYALCGPNGRPISGLDDASDCQAAAAELSFQELRAAPLDCCRDNFHMEPYEHALVAFEKVTVGTRFEQCDINEDGRIDFGSAEGDCANACADDPMCTTLTSFEQFGQFAAGIDCDDEAPPTCAGKVFVSTRDTLGGRYDVTEHAGEVYARVVGHVRQLQPAPGVQSSWILEPRILEDFVRSGEAEP